jgi:hypothetical protein
MTRPTHLTCVPSSPPAGGPQASPGRQRPVAVALHEHSGTQPGAAPPSLHQPTTGNAALMHTSTLTGAPTRAAVDERVAAPPLSAA